MNCDVPMPECTIPEGEGASRCDDDELPWFYAESFARSTARAPAHMPECSPLSSWANTVVPSGIIDDRWREDMLAKMRHIAGEWLVSPMIFPDTFLSEIRVEYAAEAHDRAIVAHNHFVRLRRAERSEEARLSAENRTSARWERLCRRWANKHPETPERARFYAAIDRTTRDLGFPLMARGQIEAALDAGAREMMREELRAKRFR